MQPETDAHQNSSDQQLCSQRFAEQFDRHDRAYEWREGVVRDRARAPQMAQR